MPRRIAAQVPQTVSRLLQGGYIKTAPTAYSAVLAHPPSVVPPRAPYPRTQDDLPLSLARSLQATQPSEPRRRDPMNAKKKLKSRMPSLKPKPIVYLHDKVRKQFYMDHPWEGLRPRSLVEKETLDDKPEPPKDVTELTWWSTVPHPEDVIDLTVHLHKHHNLSLTQAYTNSISQFHSLRAEHETASRYALIEAQAYGATFGQPITTMAKHFNNSPFLAAPEMSRGFRKESAAVATWGQAARGALLSGESSTGGMAKSSQKVKPVVTGEWTGGKDYLQGARAILGGSANALAHAIVREASEKKSPSDPSHDPLGLERMLLDMARKAGSN